MKQREIKFRYRVKDLNDGRIITWYKSLEEVEDGLIILTNKTYKTLSRDEYTGLLDKNGKEIYEGDLIGRDNVKAICKIIWSDEFMSFRMQETFWRVDPPEDGRRVVDFAIDNWMRKDLEIIGNIYENPKLVKE